MHYDSVLEFIRKFLENMHIPTTLLEEPSENITMPDNGLRKSIYKDYNEQEALSNFMESCKENTLYYVTDHYYCSYVCLQLPNPEKQQCLVIGPFTYLSITKRNYLELLDQLDIPAEMFPVFETYYYNITHISSETQFKNLINTLCETIWKDIPFTVSVVEGNLWNMPYTRDFFTMSEEDTLHASTNMAVVEGRYDLENQIMQTVSQGNLSQIDQIMSRTEGIRCIPRLTDALRDYKNYMIVFNTILRKAAEMGAVHPVYLDQLSARFARKIEQLTSFSDHSLEREMLYKYCLLVRNHSVKGHSPIIQKVINQIDLNLTGDLRLKTLSEMFNISAGYLSTLFKKETGMTLTDYVNSKRVEHAILLLNTTQLQIQTIASCCGVMDINYFTRIFKKFTGMTPKKYKELIAK